VKVAFIPSPLYKRVGCTSTSYSTCGVELSSLTHMLLKSQLNLRLSLLLIFELKLRYGYKSDLNNFKSQVAFKRGHKDDYFLPPKITPLS
jgi:hypothetical protein